MNEEDRALDLEDDWRTARPVRRSPDECEEVEEVEEPSFVWVQFYANDLEVGPRIQVQVPDHTELVVSHNHDRSRVAHQRTVFRLTLQVEGTSSGAFLNKMSMHLTRTGPTLIAMAVWHQIPQLAVGFEHVHDLAFMIAGPGIIYFLAEEPANHVNDLGPHWVLTSWDNNPRRQENMIEGFRQLYGNVLPIEQLLHRNMARP